MKRLILLLSFVLLVALTACGGQEPETPTVAAPEAAPTEAATDEPTDEPTEEPTAEPASEATTADPALIDTLWLWTARDAATPIDVAQVADPEDYNVLFNADGTFFAGLDCNRGSGTYATPGDGSITLELGMISAAACPEESLFDAFMEGLTTAGSYEIVEDGELLIITRDGATDTFRAADTLAAAPEALENADPALIDQVWYWQQRAPAGDAEVIEIPNPEDYTLTFNADGSFFAGLDCNTGGGTYTTEAPGSLNMTLERTTLALCPEESLAETMQTLFGQDVTYTISEDGLLTFTHEGGAEDIFALTPAAMGPMLTGTVWQWLGTTTGEGPLYVTDPTRTTIEFLDDGTAAIKADCNRVVATYEADAAGSITITPGPTTLAACPADSQGELFTQQLGAAGLYFFQDGELFIDLYADAGTMQFSPLPEIDLPAAETGQPTGTVNAPDGIFLRTGPGTQFPSVGTAAQGDSGALVGVSEDGLWYAIAAPGLADGQVWGAAEFIDAAGAELPVMAAPALPDSLVGRTWAWLETTTPEETIGAADPARYTVDFLADGTAAIQADCNRVVAAYTTDGQSITITPGPSTLAACPDDSQADVFLSQLSNAATFFFRNDELFIDQFASAGTMRFVSLAAVSGPVTGPVDGPSGRTFRVVSFGPTGAEQMVIEGTEITALFDEAGGTVSGTAGCNSYSGDLRTPSGAFSIGPLASTAMACVEPAGIMEQEAAFLAALSAATSYQWEAAPNTTTVFGVVNYTLADGTNGVINLVSP